MDVAAALVIAFSFFTFLPMPLIDWTTRRMKFVPMWLPVVGAAIGAAGWGLWLLLDGLAVSGMLKAASMTLFYLVATGGVHMDGMMDSADAYFSRRDTARKLEIMKDSRVGAFAVMACAAVLLFKFALFSETFSKEGFVPVALAFIPILSRSFQASMIYLFPYAKSEGLAAMYGADPDKRFLIAFALAAAASCYGIAALAGWKYLVVPGVCALYYIFYYYSSRKQFGGITGDVLGAFLEVSELIMLAAAALV
jgi:adenosylcobinamide-GDP ribazoletransferase